MSACLQCRGAGETRVRLSGATNTADSAQAPGATIRKQCPEPNKTIELLAGSSILPFIALLTFDSHDVITSLKEAGFPEKQAVGIVDGLKKVELSHVATKEDLRVFSSSTKEELMQMQADFKEEINQLRLDMQKMRADFLAEILKLHTRIEEAKVIWLKWVIPLLVGQTAAFAVIVKLLH